MNTALSRPVAIVAIFLLGSTLPVTSAFARDRTRSANGTRGTAQQHVTSTPAETQRNSTWTNNASQTGSHESTRTRDAATKDGDTTTITHTNTPLSCSHRSLIDAPASNP